MTRYRVIKRGFASWYVVDWETTRDMAGPFADSFGAHDHCARLNEQPTIVKQEHMTRVGSNQSGTAHHMSDGSIWFHPYDGGKPVHWTTQPTL
jgi:hypothetical protein